MEYKIGDTFDSVYPPEAAEWCNNSGYAHIERYGSGYIIAENENEQIDFNDPMALVDDAICELYELVEANSAIIEDQDAAICALYELIGE